LPFTGAGPLMSILVFSGLAMMLINLLNAILIACGSPAWTFKLAGPLLPVAIAGHLFAIPRFGPIGAASVTAVTASLGALAGLIAVRKLWGIRFPFSTLLRAVLLSGIIVSLFHFWPAPGIAVLAKIAVALVLVPAGFIVLGEFRKHEIRFFLSVFAQTFSRTGVEN
jgi:O-antigen/teichoic acid export membrane protein